LEPVPADHGRLGRSNVGLPIGSNVSKYRKWDSFGFDLWQLVFPRCYGRDGPGPV